MAQDAVMNPTIDSKQGQKCQIFVEHKKQWIEGEVVDIFKDDEGDWVKVKYGRDYKDINPESPLIRIPSDNVPINKPVEPSDEWEVGALCQLYFPEATRWCDAEIIKKFSVQNGEWLRVQSGKRIRDVMKRDGHLRKSTNDNTTNKAGHLPYYPCTFYMR